MLRPPLDHEYRLLLSTDAGRLAREVAAFARGNTSGLLLPPPTANRVSS